MENNPVPSTAGYKDRGTGLIVFGIIQILVAIICALFIPLMLAGQMMSAKAMGTAVNFKIIIPSIVTYLILAIAFMWLGIGSIKARRWSRALSLIIGWSWFLVGILTVAASLTVLFKTLSTTNGGSRSTVMVTMVIVSAIFSLIFIILPGAFVLFYGRDDVKLTCENRDPVERWTDRAPLPVLALALILGFGAISMFVMPLGFNGVVPMFGKLISGLPGTLLSLAIGALWAYCAWAIYKLKPVGWWIVFVVMIVFAISAFITFRNIEMAEWYSAMGYPAEQIAQMEKMSIGTGNFVSVLMAVVMIPFFGFLLWVKRYLPKANISPA